MKPKHNPYKAGTKEHSDWVKQYLIPDQTTISPAYMTAKATADMRLAKLKESYPKVTILDPYIEWLVNGGEEPTEDPIVLNAYAKHLGLLDEVNEVWQKTGLCVYVSPLYGYMPQIDSAPPWVEKDQLYEILREYSKKDKEEIRQQQGYLFVAVMRPFAIAAWQANSNSPLMVDQVRIKYEQWMR